MLKERPFLLIGSLFILILILTLVIELRTFCFELILALQSLHYSHGFRICQFVFIGVILNTLMLR